MEAKRCASEQVPKAPTREQNNGDYVFVEGSYNPVNRTGSPRDFLLIQALHKAKNIYKISEN